jgi:type VI secretion system protein
MVSGCGTLRGFFGGAVRAQVVIAQGLNQDSPVAVELVVVRDGKLLERIAELTAAQWFEQREQLRRDFTRELDSWRYEWVPGQVVPRIRRKFRAGVRGGVVFADYAGPGAHRARFDPYRPFTLILDERDLAVLGGRRRLSPLPPRKERP